MRLQNQKLIQELLEAIRDASDPKAIKSASEEMRAQLALTQQEQVKREEYIKIKNDAEKAQADLVEKQKTISAEIAENLRLHNEKITKEESEAAARKTVLDASIAAHEKEKSDLANEKACHASKAAELKSKEESLKRDREEVEAKKAAVEAGEAALADAKEEHDKREADIRAKEQVIAGFVNNLKS